MTFGATVFPARVLERFSPSGFSKLSGGETDATLRRTGRADN
jgi:hypothetical protein